MGLRDLFGGGAGRRRREEAVRLAAVEAAEDDPLFATDVVTDRAAALFVAIQRAWSTNDVQRLETMVGEELMVEWRARLADFRRKGWRNEVTVVEVPQVEYVALRNRAGEQEDRAVVLVTARLHDVVVDGRGNVLPSEDGADARIREYWTLGRRGAEWIVVSIEQEREGAHHRSAPLVAVPESDDTRLRADAVLELAAADAVPGAQVPELLSPAFSGNARTAALDLSLVDGRFAPDVLATAVGEVVDAWARAIDGPDDALATWTTPAALTALLYPTASGRARLVIRGLRIRSTTITAVTPGPPTEVRLLLEAEGVQYVEDRDTTEVVAGSKRRRSVTKQTWTLRLTEDPRRPWLVTEASALG